MSKTVPPNNSKLPAAGPVTLVPEPEDLARLHAAALPQKDQLCGPFWGALALTAFGYPADQDEAALRSGTTLAEGDPAQWLPPGASPRTDYRRRIPTAPSEPSSGTSASALAKCIEGLSGGELAVLPVAGPWSDDSVAGLVGLAVSGNRCVLVANIRTGRLWGSRPQPALLLDYLHGKQVEAPAPDWDCGHFVTIAGFVEGSHGALLILRDTYPQLGWDGYHLQPAEVVAAALERGDGSEGGVLCVCEASTADALAAGLRESGFESRHWDNGTPDEQTER